MHVRSLMITLFVKIGSGMSDLKVNRSWETRVSKKCVSFLWNPHVSDLATRDRDDLLLYIYLSDLRGNLRHQLFQEQFPYDFQSCHSPLCCRTHRWVWRQHLSSSHLVARRFRLHVHQRHQRSPLRWKQNPWLLWRWRLNKPSCARIRWDFEFEFSFTRTSASDCGLFWECGPSGACMMECPICFTNPITCPVGRLEFNCRFKHLDCISKWEFFLPGHLFVTFPTLLTATTARRNASPTTALKDGIATEPLIASALTAKVTQTVPLDSSAAIESVLPVVVCIAIPLQKSPTNHVIIIFI